MNYLATLKVGAAYVTSKHHFENGQPRQVDEVTKDYLEKAATYPSLTMVRGRQIWENACRFEFEAVADAVLVTKPAEIGGSASVADEGTSLEGEVTSKATRRTRAK